MPLRELSLGVHNEHGGPLGCAISTVTPLGVQGSRPFRPTRALLPPPHMQRISASTCSSPAFTCSAALSAAPCITWMWTSYIWYTQLRAHQMPNHLHLGPANAEAALHHHIALCLRLTCHTNVTPDLAVSQIMPSRIIPGLLQGQHVQRALVIFRECYEQALEQCTTGGKRCTWEGLACAI